MPIQISANELLKVLARHGFLFVSQQGSHIKVRKIEDNLRTTVIVPNHKRIKPGTLGNIMRRANLTRRDILYR